MEYKIGWLLPRNDTDRDILKLVTTDPKISCYKHDKNLMTGVISSRPILSNGLFADSKSSVVHIVGEEKFSKMLYMKVFPVLLLYEVLETMVLINISE